MALRFVATKVAAPKFKQNLAGLGERMSKALEAAANMAASLIQERGRADIASAGEFQGDWIGGLKVQAEKVGQKNMRISMTHSDPRVAIFEKGGVVKGKPLLWIPLSSTDAVGIRPRDYGGLYSVNNPGQKHPLLFSIKDKQPKYFGIEQITQPKRFHLAEIQKSVMANFRQLFDQAFRGH